MRNLVALSLLLALVASPAFADPQRDCQAAAGTFLTGVVTAGPQFRPGKPERGVELSHTHVRLQADQDHQSYDVAIDNVFAAGYDQAVDAVPAPLNQIRRGSHLELCGQRYTSGIGIHWVHTNCNQRPKKTAPDGWLRIVGPDGTRSDNLEGNQEYCRLWGQ